ncbi:MAG: PRD domain-containing protein [Negativicutes bacterium]|jgi:transcriptional regulatory protein LevR
MIDLPFRIKLLADTEQITSTEAAKLTEMLAMFAELWQIELTEENAGMFITHFAMTLKRVRESENLQALDRIIITEIEQSAAFSKSLLAMAEIEKLFEINLPDSEQGYIFLHLNKYFE